MKMTYEAAVESMLFDVPADTRLEICLQVADGVGAGGFIFPAEELRKEADGEHYFFDEKQNALVWRGLRSDIEVGPASASQPALPPLTDQDFLGRASVAIDQYLGSFGEQLDAMEARRALQALAIKLERRVAQILDAH